MRLLVHTFERRNVGRYFFRPSLERGVITLNPVGAVTPVHATTIIKPRSLALVDRSIMVRLVHAGDEPKAQLSHTASASA